MDIKRKKIKTFLFLLSYRYHVFTVNVLLYDIFHVHICDCSVQLLFWAEEVNMICCDSRFCPVCQRQCELLTLNRSTGPARMWPLVSKRRSVFAQRSDKLRGFLGLEAGHFKSKAAS